MSNALDPISTSFYFLEHEFGYNLNQSMSVHSRLRLDHRKLKHALTQTIARHPVLGSKIVVDRQRDRFECRWEPLPEADLPVHWNVAATTGPALDEQLQHIEYQQQNTPLPGPENPPFRLHVHDYGEAGSHLQLVLSHTAGDGKSLLLFFRDLFSHYLDEASAVGADPNSEPSDPEYVPADWETLFAVQGNRQLQQTTNRLLQAESRRRQLHRLPCYGDQRDWPIIQARRQPDGDPARRPAVLEPYPRGRIQGVGYQQEFGPIGGFNHRLTGPSLSRLRDSAGAHRVATADLITLAYVLAQQDLARQAGEPQQPVSIYLPFDLRGFVKRPAVRQSIGNLTNGIALRLQPASDSRTDLLAALKTLTEGKFNGIRNWQDSVRSIIHNSFRQHGVSYECMVSLRRSLDTGARNNTVVSHLGNVCATLSPDLQERMGVQRIDAGAVSIATPEVHTLEHPDYLFISYSYPRNIVADHDMLEAMDQFIGRLDHLVETLN